MSWSRPLPAVRVVSASRLVPTVTSSPKLGVRQAELGQRRGVVHLGYGEAGLIEHNSILFNQSSTPTIPANGGGIGVMAAGPDGVPPNSPPGTECGSVSDEDCGPGLRDELILASRGSPKARPTAVVFRELDGRPAIAS